MNGLVSSYFVVLQGYLFIYFLFKEDNGPKAGNLINFVKVMRMSKMFTSSFYFNHFLQRAAMLALQALY